MNRIVVWCFLLPYVLWGCSVAKKEEKVKEAKPLKPNVLFISIDDLRPELGCYGNSHMHTPNIDSLAAGGTVFENAYCQQAVSGPSRNSLMTGLRPDSLKIYDLGTNFRTTCPDVVTVAQHFKNNGYFSESIGKIYHIWHGNHDDSVSWSSDPWNPWNYEYDVDSISRGDTVNLHTSAPTVNDKRIAWYKSEMPDDNLNDTRIANRAIERLKELKDTSFFLGLGFLKPHLPFVAPQRFWDMYDPDSISIPYKYAPKNAPEYTLNNSGELLCCYHQFDSIPVEDDVAKNLIHGYYATVSYVDNEVGRVMKALTELGLAENTIVVIWSDHGWKLGDYGEWCKHSAYEYDTRSSLIFNVPWLESHNNKSASLVELLDVYPTLCEEAKLPVPEHTQGVSLSPILRDGNKAVKDFALSQWPVDSLMGYALRTDTYRLVSWQKNMNPDSVKGVELYDHINDPFETENIAGYPENDSIVKALHQKLLEVRGL